MLGMTEKCECPICGKAYDHNPKTCTCGFEGLAFLPMYVTDAVREQYAAQQKELDFRVFKFAKQVYYGEKAYPRSELVLYPRKTRIEVDEALERRGLAVVDPTPEERAGLPTVAVEGLLAMRSNVQALILNTTQATYNMLDECCIRSLLLGADFEALCDGGLMQYAPLRYLWVDGKNKCFSAQDNVLFSKNGSELVLYARARPGEEYVVPKSVKSLGAYSFFYPNHLKRLYLPKGIRVSKDALSPADRYEEADGVLLKVGPSFDVIYY